MGTCEFKFDLGVTVMDLVTGSKGTIICRAQWLNGCKRYTVQPKSKKKENDDPKCWCVDEMQLTQLGLGVSKDFARARGEEVFDAVVDTSVGGPREDPTQQKNELCED